MFEFAGNELEPGRNAEETAAAGASDDGLGQEPRALRAWMVLRPAGAAIRHSLSQRGAAGKADSGEMGGVDRLAALVTKPRLVGE
jgi:hypothetical protein